MQLQLQRSWWLHEAGGLHVAGLGGATVLRAQKNLRAAVAPAALFCCRATSRCGGAGFNAHTATDAIIAVGSRRRRVGLGGGAHVRLGVCWGLRLMPGARCSGNPVALRTVRTKKTTRSYS